MNSAVSTIFPYDFNVESMSGLNATISNSLLRLTNEQYPHEDTFVGYEQFVLLKGVRRRKRK